ncbi:hypothetical protein [Riemerella columbina]|uniref:hypothetical protein n=1 Tax=Riemerella columbina TaxID=103810 RepID=UPI0012EA13CE|nr:hypothetical protein [Riemerella columbina]
MLDDPVFNIFSPVVILFGLAIVYLIKGDSKKSKQFLKWGLIYIVFLLAIAIIGLGVCLTIVSG